MNLGKDFVDNFIAKHKLAVFSKSYCPFCHKAKAAIAAFELTKDSLAWTEIESREDMPEIMDYLKELTGDRTVPRVFLNGKFIGGGDAMAAAKADGSLEKILDEGGVLWKPSSVEIPENAAKKYVDELLPKKKIIVFLDASCAYSMKIKEAIGAFGIKGFGFILYLEVEHRDDFEQIKDHLRELSGVRTLPQVFIEGKFYGNGAKVLAAKEDGSFRKKLEEIGAL